MENIKPMGARPIILSPTICTFGCFTDPAWCAIMQPPPGIEKWKWHSAKELRETCIRIIQQQFNQNDWGDLDNRFSLRHYTDLNRDTDHQDPEITWFIAYEIGFLFRRREASACQFNDSLLYIPAKWGMRVMKAAEMGLSSVSWNGKMLEGEYFNGKSRANVARLLTEGV